MPGDQDVQLVNGQITVIGQTPDTTHVEIRWEESVKGYDFEDRLRALIEWAKSHGSVANGSFYADGEESEDFSRYGVRDNEITAEGGTVTYPSERNDHLIARAAKGHGRVLPRKDGRQIACYGLPSCPECEADHDWLVKELYG